MATGSRDRGHFGAGPIRIGWFALAFPALVLKYLGQGILILHNPRTRVNPFFLMVPSWGRFALLLLATAATIIASQAVISGSFSVAKQAVQLGFLPRLKIQHTSKQEGQIYVPIINWVLCTGVVALVLAFRSSSSLGKMYGVAVTGTFILNTLQDKPDVPEALKLYRKLGLLERNLDLEHASYIVSRMTIAPTDAPGMHRWGKKIFITMARNAADPIEHFGLPSERTVIMGSRVAL